MTIAYLAFQNTTAPADTNKWNDIRKNTSGLGLVDNGVATGWTGGYPSATNSIGGNGANEVGTGDAAWVDEAIIMYEGHYHGDAVVWKSFEITGLDDSKFYNLAFTASQPVDRKTEVRVNGGTSQVLNADAIQKQTDDVIFFNGISPVSGKITVEYRSVTGSSAYLMAGYIEEVAPVSDTTPPVYEVAPAVTETRENGHTISGTADEDSVFYGVRLPAGATVPTSQQVIDGQDASGSPALEADFVAASAGISADLDFVTASASTGYRYAIVAVDDEPTPNVQATPTVIDDTTAAAVVEGISAQTIRDKAGDLTPNATNLKIAVRESSDPESTVHFSTTNGSLNGSSQTSAINLESAGVTVGDTVHFSYFNPALNEGLNVDLTVEDLA